MSDFYDGVARSLYSIMRKNDGLYRTEKQAEFIKSVLIDAEFRISHRAYNNVSYTVFVCDDRGVHSMYKDTQKKGQRVHTYMYKRDDEQWSAEYNKQQAKIKARRDRAHNRKVQDMHDGQDRMTTIREHLAPFRQIIDNLTTTYVNDILPDLMLESLMANDRMGRNDAEEMCKDLLPLFKNFSMFDEKKFKQQVEFMRKHGKGDFADTMESSLSDYWTEETSIRNAIYEGL